MEDTSKATARAIPQDVNSPSTTGKRDQSPEVSSTFVAFMDDSTRPAETPTSENLTTSAKALDRWFRERQKQNGQPRLLEIPNEALVTSAGPLQITGNLTLVEEDGSITYANHLNLCRCGASKTKPVCDGQHADREFLHTGRITEVSDTLSSDRPTKITISCIKDGPVTFRGRLRLHNNLGQECMKQRGALCRCGHSTNKPFCDGSHEKVGFKSGR